jgi:hypothetical protein
LLRPGATPFPWRGYRQWKLNRDAWPLVSNQGRPAPKPSRKSRTVFQTSHEAAGARSSTRGWPAIAKRDGLSQDLRAWLAGEREIAIGTVHTDDLIRLIRGAEKASQAQLGIIITASELLALWGPHDFWSSIVHALILRASRAPTCTRWVTYGGDVPALLLVAVVLWLLLPSKQAGVVTA